MGKAVTNLALAAALPGVNRSGGMSCCRIPAELAVCM